MSSPVRPIARLLVRTQARFRNARPGSVLILVVALLVLMAIIGTAALSTNMIDRSATQQNNFNTQVDLLVEGVKNMAKATIVGDIKDSSTTPPSYRPGAGMNNTYDHWDMPLLFYTSAFSDPAPGDRSRNMAWPTGMDDSLRQQLSISNDAWLAPRYPSVVDPTFRAKGPFDPSVGTLFVNATWNNVPAWDAISAPLETPNGIPGVGQTLFDAPGVFDAGGNQITTRPFGYNSRVTNRAVDINFDPLQEPIPLAPDFVTYTVDPATGRKATFPAWTFLVTDNTGTHPYKYIAGDADGDGIADSGLKKLAIGELNGLTYYYSVRIIDNGSAVNVNTAWVRSGEFLGSIPGTFAQTSRANAGGTIDIVNQQYNIFPSSIGLAELLRTYNSGATTLSELQFNGNALTELGQIDAHRFNAPTNVTPAAPGNLRPTGVVDQLNGTVTAASATVWVDKPPGDVSGTVPRTDFAYNTLGEMLYFGLGRRLNNPGVLAQTGGSDVHFRRFSVSDSAALAYHFVFANPEASLSPLETATVNGVGGINSATPDSLYLSAPNKLATGFARGQKAYSGLVNNTPSVEGVFRWYDENFNYDAEFAANGTEVPLQFRNRRAMFTADNPVTNLIPQTQILGSSTGSLLGATAVKASVNTADFDKLYNAFLAVMTEGNGNTPYNIVNQVNSSQPAPVPPTPDKLYAYTGARFGSAADPPVAMDDRVAQSNDVKLQTRNLFKTVYDPSTKTVDANPQRMFRNPLRENDPSVAVVGLNTVYYDESANYNDPATTPTTTNSMMATQLLPQEVRKLRAALSAANTMAMRDPRQFGSVNRVELHAMLHQAANPNVQSDQQGTPVEAWVYGAEPQPYITEVYVNTDTKSSADHYDAGAPAGAINSEPYVAIELFYPYPIPVNATTNPPSIKSLQGWSLAVINRQRDAANQYRVTSIETLGIRSDGAGGFSKTFNGGSLTTSGGDQAYFLRNAIAGQERLGTYILLENYTDDQFLDANCPVQYRPKSSGLPYRGSLTTVHDNAVHPPLNKVYVRNLAKVIQNGSGTSVGGELVLFRPLGGAPPKPIDSFDFSGLANTSASNEAHVWHYSRQVPRTDGVGGTRYWGWVYPGRYDGGLPGGLPAGSGAPRQQGTCRGVWNCDDTAVATDPGNHDPFGDPNFVGGSPLQVKPSFGVVGGVSSDNGSNRTYPVAFFTQLLSTDQPGWNIASSATPNKFPFGAFAREGDMLQIPFMGAYRVKITGTGAADPGIYDGTPSHPYLDIELNSLPMDSSFCEDTDVTDDENWNNPPQVATPIPTYIPTFEQLGRFCPLQNIVPVSSTPAGDEIDDLDPLPETTYRYGKPGAAGEKAWRYRWTTRLFDFLTTQDPQTDYLPNIRPENYPVTGQAPVPVSNEGGTAGRPLSDASVTSAAAKVDAENGTPLHGRININTASWRVLAAINWTPFEPGNARRDEWSIAPDPTGDGNYTLSAGGDGVDDNIEIAKLIAWYRDGIVQPGFAIGPRGPFQSIYDLYRVPGIKNYYNELLNNTNPLNTEPDDADGDLSPYNPTSPAAGPFTDGVRFDFEEKFLLINRVGNLITTRSDSFTVYVLVQGWRNAGSTDLSKPPELVVQRRAAFIADRSPITASGGQLKIINVPTE